MNCPFKIYLAGKIRANCWRHRLVPNLRDSTWGDAPLYCDTYLYVGPFFVGCDHRCYHGESTHGNYNKYDLCRQLGTTRREIRHRCLAAVEECDIFVAYIDSHDCYGTIAEIQHALDISKLVVIAFAPGIATVDKNDYWFTSCSEHRVHYDVSKLQLSGLIESLCRGF